MRQDWEVAFVQREWIFVNASVSNKISQGMPWGKEAESENVGNGLETCPVFVRIIPELFSYDDDGNLTEDGCWNYTWNGENRLIAIESTAGVPSRTKSKLTFQYDAEGRRVSKVVYTWTGTAWMLTKWHRYAYHGWNLIAEVDAQTGELIRTYVWGLDLSGTFQGAGGIGGLLWVNVESGSHAGRYFAAYDGNGNVMGLVSASDGSVVAQYEYGPFAEPLRATGPLAADNPFRFSTKYCDDESGFFYYGYRCYAPSTGRWPNRDPIEERGGRNLYGFVGNDPIRQFDRLGLDYYIKIIKGTCGVNHRVLVGDDGNGNSFEVEIYPLVKKWYQEYRRFCGKGVIQYTPRTGPATNWLSGEGVRIEKHVDTTPEQDAAIAAKAKSLDGKSITYCLVVQDCRAIEDCVLWGTVSERIKDQLELLWDVIMEQVNPPR